MSLEHKGYKITCVRCGYHQDLDVETETQAILLAGKLGFKSVKDVGWVCSKDCENNRCPHLFLYALELDNKQCIRCGELFEVRKPKRFNWWWNK